MTGTNWTLVSHSDPNQSDEELKQIFGSEAIISRVGNFNLIHLDSPDPAEIKKREAEFSPDSLFEDDCPLCQMMKEQGGSVVYDSYDDRGEAELLDDSGD
ncbi:MAG TPA: hypothetical protein VKZ59_15430 [Acidobacteriota bacterium]|nr:hypothetical protein [Acidobacteriota bacterium]